MRALAVVVLAAACAHRSPVGELRFKNQPPVWRVDDRAPLPGKPASREYNRTLYHADGFAVRRATRALEMRDPVRSRDVNALDEVPDSSWFTNRIGVRDMTLDELRRGANVSPSPFDHVPWTITGAKIGGMSLGFVFKDALGAKYILKFDQPHQEEMETGANIVVSRILHAIGYNVPEDFVGEIRRTDLRIAAGTKTKTSTGARIPLTDEALDAALARVAKRPDGRIRVLASRFVPGTPIGPYAREGTRADDPNDVIPHEQRRSLRGQFAIFAWLNHTDMQEDNTLDTFVDGHVVHYLIDFGKALGVMGHGLRWQTVGHTYRLDVGMAMRTLLGFGLWKRPWDDLDQPNLHGIGLIDAEHYDPGAWRPNSFYWPYEDKDRFDAFWGAKLLIRFTREELAAIVDEARFSDARSARYMVDTLVARQRKTARYWFDRVAPLDQLAVEPDAHGTLALSFTDLALSYRLHDVTTRYVIDAFDHDGRALGIARTIVAARDGHMRIAGIPVATDASAYTIVRIRVRRNARELPAVVVHLARDARGRMQIIGLRRR